MDGSAVAAVKDELKLNMLRFMRCVYVLCAPLVCVTKSDVISKTRKQNEKWIICFFGRSMTRHIPKHLKGVTHRSWTKNVCQQANTQNISRLLSFLKRDKETTNNVYDDDDQCNERQRVLRHSRHFYRISLVQRLLFLLCSLLLLEKDEQPPRDEFF